MHLRAKIDAGFKLAALRVLGGRRPIIVRWNATNQCTARCTYCETWKSSSDELTTIEALRMLREFHEAGMRRLCFSGGEPLTRGDIDELIHYGAARGVSMEMNTNGLALDHRRHRASLRQLDLIKISLDGPEHVHDAIRGVKMFSVIIRNAEMLERIGVRFGFTTTLVRDNTSLETVDELLELAARFKTFVAFQPAVPTTKWGTTDHRKLADAERLRSVFEHLIPIKRRTPWLIRNSLVGLRHLRHWPELPEIHCTAGQLFVVAESNGDLYACERTEYPPDTVFPNVRSGVADAFSRIVSPRCSGCGFCGALELNFLWNLNLTHLSDVIRIVGFPDRRERRR